MEDNLIKHIKTNVRYTSGINLMKILPSTDLDVDAPLVCN